MVVSAIDPATESPAIKFNKMSNELSNKKDGGIKRSTSSSQINGSLGSPPPIPHISNNIIPLSNILKFYTQEAYKQLLTVIENLSSTVEAETDSNRKKKFLTSIISLRQEFIKVYTLVKWAQNSKDVSKLIDLLNWLRGQEFFFDQLGFGLNELNRYSGAKLPNSDLLTSLEVLIKGRPQLPSYNLIKPLKISTEKTLEVLQDLNLVLTTRMALINDLPPRFINNYSIKDGRITFTIPNEFQVSVTVANDLLIDNDEDYYQSPFFFIDFKFLFGINPETSLITHKDDKIVTQLPKQSYENLERVVNQTLLRQGLSGLYDTLHKYSISFKLYLIARQLKELSINSKWKNVIQFKYQSSLIIINYWSSHYLSRNWKSFIELGIDKNYNLNFRWFKNGKYTIDHNTTISDNQAKAANNAETAPASTKTGFYNETIPGFGADDEDDLSVDLILNIIINKHSESLISKIHQQISDLLPEDSCSILSPHQLLLKLTPTKSTIFAINPLNGFFYFIEPSPIQTAFTKKINSQPTVVKNRNFITETCMVSNIVQLLIQLKLESFNKEINNKLVTTEWISNEIITLNDYETTKLYNFIIDKKEASNNKVQLYRCKNWPSSWFLINLIGGLTSKTYWWVARIKSIKGEWKIQWVHELKFENEEGLNYEFFNNLPTLCSNMIIDHMISEELQVRKIQYLNVDSTEAIEKFNLPKNGISEDRLSASQRSANSSAHNIIYESVIMVYNKGDLLPIGNSSTCLFLKVQLTNVNNVTQMRLTLLGSIRNLPLSGSNDDDFAKLNLSFRENMFEIHDLIDLSARMNGNEHNFSAGGTVEGSNSYKDSNELDTSNDSNSNNTNRSLLDSVFNNLNKLNQFIKTLDQLNKIDIEVVSNQINEIAVKVDPHYQLFKLILPKQEALPITIESAEEEDNEVKLIVTFLNQYLVDTSESIIGAIKYLKEIVPLFQTIKLVREHLDQTNTLKLPNGVLRLNFDTRLQSLNVIQFVYNINYTAPNQPKKVLKDKILICFNFRTNKFDTSNLLLLRMSLKENLNSKNLKYKKLFESIFKAINDYDNRLISTAVNSATQLNGSSTVHEPNSNGKTEMNSKAGDVLTPGQTPGQTPGDSPQNKSQRPVMFKFNYDYLMEPRMLQKLMIEITDCFLNHLKL